MNIPEPVEISVRSGRPSSLLIYAASDTLETTLIMDHIASDTCEGNSSTGSAATAQVILQQEAYAGYLDGKPIDRGSKPTVADMYESYCWFLEHGISREGQQATRLVDAPPKVYRA